MPETLDELQLTDLETWLREVDYWCVTAHFEGGEDNEARRFMLAQSKCPRQVWRLARAHKRHIEKYGPELTRTPEKVCGLRLEKWIEGKGWRKW